MSRSANHRSILAFLLFLLPLACPSTLPAQVAEGNIDRDGVVVPKFPVPAGSVSILNSGEGTVNLPLSVPPGVRRMAPALGLSYSSAAGDVGLGAGWALDLGYPEAVRRVTRFGVPAYDAGDGYSFEGQDLIPTKGVVKGSASASASGRGASYRTRVDSFQRILSFGDSWEVTETDGTRLEYGTSDASRSAIAGRGTYAWHLSRVSDPLGNAIELAYEGPAEARRLAIVRYTVDAGGKPIGQEQLVSFVWELRPDPRTEATFGALIERDHRLRTIETKSSSNVVRTYELCYAGESCTSTPEPLRRHSLLDSVIETAVDGTTQPPRHFRYQERQPGWVEDSGNKTPLAFADHWYDPNRRQWRLDDTGVRMGDVNGDGMIDLLRSNVYTEGRKGHGEVYLYTASSSGNRWALAPGWEVPYQFVTEDAFLNVIDLGVRVVDVNGDGLADLIRSNGGIREVCLNNGSGWNQPGGYFLPDEFEFVFTTGIHSEDRGVRIADVNADGLPDLLRAVRFESPRLVYLNNGADGWDPAPTGLWELPLDFIDRGNEVKPDMGVRLVDINADGLTDLVRAFNHGNAVREVWLNDGSGWALSSWSFPVPFYNIQFVGGLFFNFDFGVQVTDLNGDRYPDVIFAIPGTGNQNVYLNDQSGGFVHAENWTIPIPLVVQVITGQSSWYYADHGVRVVDVDGDGLADLLHGAFVGNAGIAKTYLANPAVSDLLAEYTNPLGGQSTIEYGQVSGFGLPAGQMPFQRAVATKLTESGGLDPAMVTEFEYREGLYDSLRREFRGYRHAWEDYADATSREREFYLDEGRRGRLKVETRRDTDAKAYEQTAQTFSSAQSGGVFTTNPVLTSFTQFHQDDEESLVFRMTQFTHDTYGNALTVRERDWGTLVEECEDFTKPPTCFIVRRAGSVTRSQRRSYALNSAAWIVSLPQTVERFEGDLETSLSFEESHYDGLPLGQVGQGLLTQKILYDRRLEGLLLYGSDGTPGPSTPGSSAIVATFEHDAYGNVILERNGRGHATHLDFAPNGFLFPFSIRRDNPGGATIQRTMTYDGARGVLLGSTDPNGHATAYSYDGLGRLLTITHPGDPPGDPSLRVSAYRLDASPPYMEVEERLDDHRTRIVRHYVDGLGREKSKVQGAQATWAVSGLTRYNNRGRVGRVYEPFFQNSRDFVSVGPSVTLSTAYGYEDDKVAVIVHPGGSRSSNFYEADTVVQTDESGEQTRKRVDAFGLLREVANAVGTTQYTYDGLGGLSLATDPRVQTEYFHDARGLLRGVNGPDGTQAARNGHEIWNDYDEQGNQTYHWSGSDVWRKHYDALDRETHLYVSRDFERSFKADHIYAYDRTVNGIGRLGIVVGYGPPTTWNVVEYDERGRASKERFLFRNLDAALADVDIAYGYNRQGDLVSLTDPRGNLIEYGRNFLGQIKAAGGQPAIRYNNGWQDRIADLDYDASGRVTAVAYGHNIDDVFAYDPRGRMTGILGSGPLNLTYEYFPAGNLQSEVGSGVSMSYEYDKVHRLETAVGQIGSTTLDLEYTYDASGNMLTVSGTGAAGVTYQYLTGTNRLSSLQFSGLPTLGVEYDPKGNLTDVEDNVLAVLGRSYTYDGLSRLRGYATEKSSGSMIYDGRGRKVQRTLPGGGEETYFHTVEGEVLATYETGRSGAEWTTYLSADGRRLAAVDQEEQFAYMHSDRLGSIRAMTSYKAPPGQCLDCETHPGKCIPVRCPPVYTLLWKGHYLPFGAEVESQGEGDNFRFTGQELEEGAGIYDYGARYYDPTLRRFLQIDDAMGVPNDPRTLNRYSYGLNNPLRYVDPTGNGACDPTDPFAPIDPMCLLTSAAGDETQKQAERAERERNEKKEQEKEKQKSESRPPSQTFLVDADKQKERDKRYNTLMLAAVTGNISQAVFEKEMATLLEVSEQDIPPVISDLGKLPGIPLKGDRAQPQDGGLFTQDVLDKLQRFPSSGSSFPSAKQTAGASAQDRARMRARTLWQGARVRRSRRR